jgi:flavin reductase (DIM6/NTAB) family NADH-FMN oxidoreductase RutF
MVGEHAFRDLMAAVCAQVTIVTAAEDGPFGTTVSAFASLSLRPPMITVALDRGSRLLEPVLRTRRFGVNVLGQGQEEIARLFAQRSADRFAAVDWHYDHGLPRLCRAGTTCCCSARSATPRPGPRRPWCTGTVPTAPTPASPPVRAARLPT